MSAPFDPQFEQNVTRDGAGRFARKGVSEAADGIDALRPEIFYHGTPAVLRPGDTLVPANEEARVYECSANVVYMVTDPESARQWGEDACDMLGLDDEPHVYACSAPNAVHQPHDDEPNQWVAPTATVLYEVE